MRIFMDMTEFSGDTLFIYTFTEQEGSGGIKNKITQL